MSKWVVAKFGGSSVKDAEAMLRCANVIETSPEIKIVVISATQNTTNQLEFIARAAQRGDEATLQSLINELTARHSNIAEELFSSEAVHTELKFLYDEIKFVADSILKDRFYTPKIMDQLYSLGERMSSLLVSDLLRLRMPERKVVLLDARNVIKTNSDYQKAEPQIDLIAQKAHELIFPHLNAESLVVTQGFIGKDLLDNTTTLGREGSDYSAALFGEAIDASLVQIWTDVPGIASSDPRLVKDARFIPTLSYDEATALASLGAKVLFPTTLLPTKRKNIPVYVGSSLNPSLGGTMVTKNQDGKFKLKAVSLLQKNEYSIISFVGCHLDQASDLVKELKGHLGDLVTDFYDLTSVSVSFKISESDKAAVLLKAHDILNSHY
ncbi:MAG: aspartate kinase [Bdellovibrionales bacterium]|nr:aspartate kinase [Bdellovibrionales bacterium]